MDNDKIVDAKFKTFGCFAGNVEINTVGKRKPIKDIKVGDQVWAWNGKSIVENSVKEVKTQFVDIEDLLCFEFQESITFSIIATREHVFWGADNKPVLAEDLKPGDELYGMSEIENIAYNEMKIRSISKINHGNMLRGVERNDQGQAKVYDLVLEDGAHVYFSSRVGSHNCGSAIASSSLATEWVKDMTIDEALGINNVEIVKSLSLPPVKVHCSVLAEDAIKAAISDYRKKKAAAEQNSK